LIVLNNILKPRLLGEIILIIFALSWVSQYFFFILDINYDYFLGIMVIIGLNLLLEKIVSLPFLKKLNVKKLHVVIILGIFRILFGGNIWNYSFFFGFIILTLLYVIIRMFIIELGGVFSKNVLINELKVGMVLAESITKKGEKKVVEWFNSSQFNRKNSLIGIRSGGISKEDIKKIKSLYKKGIINFKEMRIQETVSFAPFIFFGALFTLFFGKSVVLFFLGG
jgi:hypothetical protein